MFEKDILRNKKKVSKEARKILHATSQENGLSAKDFASTQRSNLTKSYSKKPANS